MTMPDHYQTLGVGPDATQEQITRAYRALMRRHHPDTRVHEPGRDAAADAAFRGVRAAYEVLGDPARRAAYDRAWRPPPRRTRTGDGPAPPIVAGPVRWQPARRNGGGRGRRGA